MCWDAVVICSILLQRAARATRLFFVVSVHGLMGAQLESELEAARRAAHPGDLKGKETELQRAKEEARRLGEERAKAQKARLFFILFVICSATCLSSLCPS